VNRRFLGPAAGIILGFSLLSCFGGGAKAAGGGPAGGDVPPETVSSDTVFMVYLGDALLDYYKGEYTVAISGALGEEPSGRVKPGYFVMKPGEKAYITVPQRGVYYTIITMDETSFLENREPPGYRDSYEFGPSKHVKGLTMYTEPVDSGYYQIGKRFTAA
jgi:hypothetical protein